tara:strand:+ start:257 stop:454 length:198 start_codon:yes stop_codon:yes gene_type:complete
MILQNNLFSQIELLQNINIKILKKTIFIKVMLRNSKIFKEIRFKINILFFFYLDSLQITFKKNYA